MSTTIYFGPPGTGKTETLLGRAREELERGTDPKRVAFVAFTRRAAREARARAGEDLGLDEAGLPWWRTLHSAATRELAAGARLMTRRHWDALGEAMGLDFGDLDAEGRVLSNRASVGGYAQGTYYLRRARLQSLAWDDLLRDLGQLRARRVYRFAESLELYKRERGLYDYADLLDEAPGDLGAEVLFLDEAQDLTPQQWRYFERLRGRAQRTYVAGDDDQAVFGWAGADVTAFQALGGDRVVLESSHRVPRAAFALADRVVHRVRTRVPKTWSPADRDGLYVRCPSPDELDLTTGTWLLLARTQYRLRTWEERCRALAVRYVSGAGDSVRDDEVRAILAWERGRRGEDLDEHEHETLRSLTRGIPPGPNRPIWHEALTGIPRQRRDYYERVLRDRGQAELRRPARIRISTVHGAKGAEAENVAVLPDLTPRVYRNMRGVGADEEHRLWYVALTRCSQRLFWVRAEGDLYYRP